MVIAGAYYSAKEFYQLVDILKRVRARQHADEDLEFLCAAMERRLNGEERLRDYMREYQRRRKQQKQQE
jgi:hypothetical protein